MKTIDNSEQIRYNAITARVSQNLQEVSFTNISIKNSVVPGALARIIFDKGLKKGVVAKRAGITDKDFSNMLNGRKLIKPCDILNIANALDCTPNDLFAFCDANKPTPPLSE